MTLMTISNLPMDLLSEIVRKVPMKYTRAVRLTCKKWDTLWKMHMCNARKGESRMVALMDNNLHLISAIIDDVDHPSTEIKGTLSCLNEHVKIIKVFHCDGLLLCVLKDSFGRLVVWNPYLGQTRWIEPPSYSYQRYHKKRAGLVDMHTYALGYNHNKKSHKILRFMDEGSHLLNYDIYDFDSNLWRTRNIDIPHWQVPFYEIGVPLNGNTYWLARYKNSVYECDRLVCFDFTTERFGPVFLPLPFTPEEGRQVSSVLSCLKGDKLAVLLDFQGLLKLEIWVTSVIDPTKVSWSKFLAVDTGPVFNRLFGFSSMGLFVDEEKKVAMVFYKCRDTRRYTLNIIGKAGFFRVVDLPVEYVKPDYNCVCSHYTPSLVQIKKPPLRVCKRRKTTK